MLLESVTIPLNLQLQKNHIILYYRFTSKLSKIFSGRHAKGAEMLIKCSSALPWLQCSKKQEELRVLETVTW